MKRIIGILLIMCLVLSFIQPVFADNELNLQDIPEETQKKVLSEDDTYILNRTRIIPEQVNKSMSKSTNTNMIIEPESVAIPYGTVDIIDRLGSESGYVNALNKSFSSFNTFKYASIKIISSVPLIGDVFVLGSEIYSALSAIYSDLKSINGSRQVEVTTKYAYRYFTHDLYVWDYSKTWEWVGESISKYYYTHYAMFAYLDNVGEYRWKSYSFSHSRGYSPKKIDKAPNYKDYSDLSNISYESWIYGRTYRETY